MRKFLIVFLSIVIFIVSYKVRIGFLGTNDYNNPSDATEYKGASINLRAIMGDFVNITDEPTKIKYLIQSLNTHGVPLYIVYLAFLSTIGLSHQVVTPLLSSFLPPMIFITALLFFPFWLAFIIGIATAIYTPIFTFIFSYMPEGFTAVIIPLFVIGSSLLVNLTKKKIMFIFAGVLLALLAFSRHVFTYYGLLFILAWYFITPKNLRKKQILLLSVGYIPVVLIWLVIVKWSGAGPYPESWILSQIYHSFNLATQGWAMGHGVPEISWGKIMSLILHQNPIEQIILRFERIILFLQHPAVAYTTSFPFSLDNLKILHTPILLFGLFGIRSAFRNKILFLISLVVIWNTVFASLYVIEELRLQLPVVALIILLAGAGIQETIKLLRNTQTQRLVIFLLLLTLVSWVASKYLIGLEIWFLPFFADANFWLSVNVSLTVGILVFVSRKLWRHDKKESWILSYKWFRMIPSIVPLIIFILFLIPYLKNPKWHSWYTPLIGGKSIEQMIILSRDQVNQLEKKQGYLLIDIKDPNAAHSISIFLNGVFLEGRLSMAESHSPVDLQAIRQWQPNWPRRGYGIVEEEMASSATWPNMRQWLIVPISGSFLKETNRVIVKNDNYFTSQHPLVFGDFPPYGSQNYYWGPTPRIFQGKHAYNKYQVDGDFRLYEKQILQSISSTSRFFLANGGEYRNDLSSTVGTQTGRYRIFFLFPYTTGDPEDIF